jgi:hypothetical protein
MIPISVTNVDRHYCSVTVAEVSALGVAVRIVAD